MLIQSSLLWRAWPCLFRLVTRILFGLLLCGYFSVLSAQVLVSITPSPYQQFLDNAGKPLAGGKVFTYDAGTTNLRNTYIDSTGTIQNTDPIVLDAAGVPASASGVEVGIWLANQSYKFCIQNSLGVQLRCVDNIPGYAFGILNLANTWSQPQTFSQPITILPTDNQIIFGAPGNQTTLDAPPPTGNVTLHLPNITDTLVGRTTTDTLTNKTLTSPTVTGGTFSTPTINGAVVVNSPATYMVIANANPTGTTASTLTKLINSTAQATIAQTTDTGGVIGITVSGAGNTGNAVVQAGGLANCVFDGATGAGDYAQISATVGGDCHDTGSAVYPLKGQVIGRVMTTNVGAGTYQVLLFPPDIEGSAANSIGVTIANNGAGTTINTLTKLTGAPSTAIMATTGDTGGIVGITTAGAGTTGSAVIGQIGLITCQFDGATTAGDYVQNSTIVNGDCHDAGATLPGGGQVIGRVLTTNVGTGAYTIDLFPPEQRAPPTLLSPSITTNSGTAIGASNVTWVTKAVTMPSSGCPCRVRASYGVSFTSAASGTATFWVEDNVGPNQFATSRALTQTASGNAAGSSASSISPVTYTNGQAVTFTGKGNTDSAGGISTAAPPFGSSQLPWLAIEILTSQ